MKNQLCVSKAALAPDGPAPEIGDSVTVEIAGTIARVEGDKYYLDAQSANGTPMPAEASEPTEGGSDDEMRGMAESADAEAGYV